MDKKKLTFHSHKKKFLEQIFSDLKLIIYGSSFTVLFISLYYTATNSSPELVSNITAYLFFILAPILLFIIDKTYQAQQKKLLDLRTIEDNYIGYRNKGKVSNNELRISNEQEINQ